jgi:hypothetical protein
MAAYTRSCFFFVMPGLDPGIHSIFFTANGEANGMDRRVKLGGDEWIGKGAQ